MIGDILQPTHLLLILLVALLVLGPKRLPEVGRSLGKGLRDFRGAMAGIEEHASGLLDSEEPAASPGVHADPAATEAAAAVVAEAVDPAVPATVKPAVVPAATPSDSTRQGAEPDPSEYAD